MNGLTAAQIVLITGQSSTAAHALLESVGIDTTELGITVRTLQYGRKEHRAKNALGQHDAERLVHALTNPDTKDPVQVDASKAYLSLSQIFATVVTTGESAVVEDEDDLGLDEDLFGDEDEAPTELEAELDSVVDEDEDDLFGDEDEEPADDLSFLDDTDAEPVSYDRTALEKDAPAEDVTDNGDLPWDDDEDDLGLGI